MLVLSYLGLKVPCKSLLGLALACTGCWLGHKKLESSRSVARESGPLNSACCLRIDVGRGDDCDSGTKERSPKEGLERGFIVP